jgi:GntR family transcriptional repressor for pyruvate dehydrogenase complex
MPLKAVETRRLYQEIADQIAEAIRSGEYRPGERLPPERDLSRLCGVSRPVVREAMIALEIAGFVEVRGGSGVFVRAVPASPGRVPDTGEDPYEAFMARRTIEGEIAAIAAANAQPADLAELAAALEGLRSEPERGPGPDSADRRFHLALARATHNTAFVQIIHFIWDELLNPGALWIKLRERRAVRPTRIAEHEAIYDAVAARDPGAARNAMVAHFEGAIRDFLERTRAVPRTADRSDAPAPGKLAAPKRPRKSVAEGTTAQPAGRGRRQSVRTPQP